MKKIRQPQRLDALPKYGKVAIGRPDEEEMLRVVARHKQLDYVLSNMVKPGDCLILDMSKTTWSPDGGFTVIEKTEPPV